MADSAKETVIIVHGTFVDNDSQKRGWYEPVDGRPGGEPFPEKLDPSQAFRAGDGVGWWRKHVCHQINREISAPSSSASRLTAGAFGFLTFTHWV
jgi:hypothetical protein